MDKEQARFILRSFRPDGSDVNDTDFAEALAFALKDREVGEWLASERAFDASFAQALGTVDLPDHLREDIIGCLAGQRGDFPQAESQEDALMVGAFASIQAPAFLRDEVIAAMDRTVVRDRIENPFWRRAGIPLAAAAGIALAFVFTRPDEPPSNLVAGQVSDQVRSEVVRAGFIDTVESPAFHLDMKVDDPQVLVQHLRSRKLPCPGCLPPGLEQVKSIGCREFVINGKHGSVICFDLGKDGVVHLVIFMRSDMDGEFPEMDQPHLSQDGPWASGQWQHERKAYILLGNTDVEKLAALF